MKIRFYGTGSSEGFPSMFCSCDACCEARRLRGRNIRTRSSCGIDDVILVDFPADTFAHSIWGGLELTKIHTILFTHPHLDHLYAGDLVNTAPPMALRSQQEDIRILGPKEAIQAVLDMCAIEKRGRMPVQPAVLQPAQTATVNGYRITAVQTIHDAAVDCYIYVIEHDGKTLLYGNDSAYFPPETWEELCKYHYDCVILDCTSVTESHVFASHMGFEECRMAQKRLLDSACANEDTVFVATHFAHTFAPLHERITPIFAKEGIIAAFDGMEIEI